MLDENQAQILDDLTKWHNAALGTISRLGYAGLSVDQVLACQAQDIARLKTYLEEERESARDFLQEHYELQAHMRLLKASIPDTENLYTCIGKGGEYGTLGVSVGAGVMRGTTLTIYRDMNSGEMFHRTLTDFTDRMTKIKQENGPVATHAIAPTAAQIKEALNQALEERNRPHYGDNRGDWVHLTIEETQRAVTGLIDRLNAGLM